jgi:hypothetical protein
MLIFQNTKPGWIELNVPKNEHFEKSCAFLDRLSLEATNVSLYEQNDYLNLRSNPLQKSGNGKYRVIFDLFLIKKAYNGMYFELTNLSQKNKDLFKGNFAGIFRSEFSEGVLVYEVLNKMFEHIPSTRITGNEYKAVGLEREPDYYLRIKNKIFLFESKDFFIKGSIKLSYDFNKIEAELKNSRLEKAVLQLSENIKRTIAKGLVLDSDYDVNDIEIYPIIIVHDSVNSATALNYWVNYWLEDEINDIKNKAAFANFDLVRIRPLTIIEIDSFILYLRNFAKNELELSTVIDDFHRHVQYDFKNPKNYEEAEEHALRSGIPFSEFIRDYCHKKDIEIDIGPITDILGQYGIA